MNDASSNAPDHAATGGPSEPSQAVVDELDRLDQESRKAPGEIAPQIAFWTAVAALDQWYFINRGSEESPRPYALSADNGPMLCIYTSAAAAGEAARALGFAPAGETVPLFAVPLPPALDWAMAFLERGVVGVTADYPQRGAWCPLPNLAQLRDKRETGR